MVAPASFASSDNIPLGPTFSSVPIINATLPPLPFPTRSESLPTMTNSLPSSPVQAQYDTISIQRFAPLQPVQHHPSSQIATTPAEGPPLVPPLRIGSTYPIASNSPQTHTFGSQALTGTAASTSTPKITNDAVTAHLYSDPGRSSPSANTLSFPNSNSRDADFRHAPFRDSRISLPDEAKQYIASMQQSPVTDAEPSKLTSSQGRTKETQDLAAISTQPPPLFEHPNPHHRRANLQFPPHDPAQTPTQATSYTPREKNTNAELSPRLAKISHPPMNHDMIQVLRDGPPPFPRKSNRDELARAEPEHDEFLDLDDDDGGVEDDMDDEDASRPSEIPSPTKRAAAEDFPLPPSNPPGPGLSQPQPQTLTNNKDWLPTGATIQLSGDPLSSSYSHPDQSSTTSSSRPLPAAFRALPLLASDLPYTQIKVSHSSIRPNDRGKDVSSFIVELSPGNGKEGWKVEKLYSDVLALDARVRASVGKGVGKKIASLPEGKLWRDHAPAKVDQRKVHISLLLDFTSSSLAIQAALETYLQTLINLPVKNKDEIIAFFTSDIVRDTQKPVSQVGYKEGYLTKRGKNFGGWKTRFFVLQGPVLEYFESVSLSLPDDYSHANQVVSSGVGRI